MTTSLHRRSSWIASMAYKSIGAESYLAFFLKPVVKVNGVKEEEKALLYGGPNTPLPSWVPGLIKAGRVGKPVSPGRVYHRLVKGKYQGQVVTGKENVKQLREMMK